MLAEDMHLFKDSWVWEGRTKERHIISRRHGYLQ